MSERTARLAVVVAFIAGCGDAGGGFTELDVPAGAPRVIIAASTGDLWFTENGGIGRVTPARTLTEFPLASGEPSGIAEGPDGNIWFTIAASPAGAGAPGNMIGRFDIVDASVVTFPTSIPDGDPYDIVAGPDGNLWFTDRKGSNVGRLSLAGDATIVPVPMRNPLGIVKGGDGGIWFSTLGGIGRLSPSSQAVDWFGQDGGYTLTAAPDGAVWFSEPDRSAIGRVSSSGDVASFDLPDAMLALGMTIGPGANVWFAAAYSPPSALGDRIGWIAASGAVTYVSIPTPHGAPVGIARAPDGALWFTENAANKLGRFDPP